MLSAEQVAAGFFLPTCIFEKKCVGQYLVNKHGHYLSRYGTALYIQHFFQKVVFLQEQMSSTNKYQHKYVHNQGKLILFLHLHYVFHTYIYMYNLACIG